MSTTDHTHFPDAQAIGRILQSNSHIDYTAGIYTEHDVDNPPDRSDYQFGQPVVVRTQANDTTYAVIGVIYHSRLVDPDAGTAAPRLASGEVDETFRPSLVDERTTLVGIALLGTATLNPDPTDRNPGQPDARLAAISQSIPPWTLEHHATVRRCPDETFQTLHLTDDEFQMTYYPRLREIAGPLGAELATAIIDRLRETTTGYDDLLDVIERKTRLQSSTDRGMLQ